MSKYEMLNYENLLVRIGIDPDSTWFCGDNQAENPIYDQPGTTYDEYGAGYLGKSQGHPTLRLSEDINVNGLLLNHRDKNGTIWLCTGIEGWWTTPSAEIADVPAPYWDGSMLTTGRYTARTITITGCFIPPDPKLVWYNRDAILRCAAIVRGVGLLALCGNESPTIKPGDPFYDPAKMTAIQMADAPLIETIKPSGYTEFSLSFRCYNPTKLSVSDHYSPLGFGSANVNINRTYAAFSGKAPADTDTTSYEELTLLAGADFVDRDYGSVYHVNADALISGEELTEPVIQGPPYKGPDMTTYRKTGGGIPEPTVLPSTTVHNSGNYFAFPIFVLGEVWSAGAASVTIQNITTAETLKIQKPVTKNWTLVIDTGMRRVAHVDPGPSIGKWVWDDRSHLTLTSQWISLAPGDNKITVSTGSGTELRGVAPQIWWRDTWIG